jgi:CubicO group peptidase (beta-lactamase class C family)
MIRLAIHFTLFVSLTSLSFAIDFSELDSVVEGEMQRAQCPGAVVAVALDHEIVFACGYGKSNLDTSSPVTKDMLFRVGSTTKLITATGLMLLAQEGRLDVHAPISRYVPDLEPTLGQVTTHQLLTHTSGLSDTNSMYGPHDESTLADKVRSLTAVEFFDEAGKIYSYSNPGYWTAGHVLESVAAQPFADFLQDRLFEPLKMSRTTFRPTVAMTWPLAVGHGPEGRGPPSVIRPLADNAATWPAGQMFSTAEEFAGFCIAFMKAWHGEGNLPIHPTMASVISAPHVEVPHSNRHYGYGLTVRQQSGLTWLSHSGSRLGYGSHIRMCPEKNLAIVILCNRTGVELLPVAEKVIAIVTGPSSGPAKETSPKATSIEELERHVGVYRNGKQTIVWRKKDSELCDQFGRQIQKLDEFHWLAQASRTGPTLEVTTVQDKNGMVSHLMLRGRAYKRVSR